MAVGSRQAQQAESLVGEHGYTGSETYTKLSLGDCKPELRASGHEIHAAAVLDSRRTALLRKASLLARPRARMLTPFGHISQPWCESRRGTERELRDVDAASPLEDQIDPVPLPRNPPAHSCTKGTLTSNRRPGQRGSWRPGSRSCRKRGTPGCTQDAGSPEPSAARSPARLRRSAGPALD